MKFACLKWLVFPFILFLLRLRYYKTIREDERIRCLKIGLDCEEELVDENAFECSNIILFVEHQHCLFVINRIHCAERNRAITVSDENTIAHNSCCTLVSVSKCLNVAEQNKYKKSFLEDIALAVDESHGVFKCLADLELVV